MQRIHLAILFERPSFISLLYSTSAAAIYLSSRSMLSSSSPSLPESSSWSLVTVSIINAVVHNFLF